MDPGLKEELHNAILTDVPDFVEHIFPDKFLPLPVSQLMKGLNIAMYRKSTGLWTACPNLFVASTNGGTERKVALFFNRVGNAMLSVCKEHQVHVPANKRTWTSTFSERPLPGGGAGRKPDLLLLDGNDPQWSKVLSHGELRSTVSGLQDSMNQLVNGAYLVFSTQDDRRFHVALSVCTTEIRLLFFDRSGVVGSTAIDLHKYPETFVRILAGLMLTDRSILGYDPTILRGPDGIRQIRVGGALYDIVSTQFVSDVIRGRGTVCWHVQRGGIDYVVKDTWADISRTYTEAEILKKAHGIEGVPEVIAAEVVKIHGDEDSTSHARSIIDVNSYIHGSLLGNLEIRLHRRLVVTPFAEPITSFRSKQELISVFMDLIQSRSLLYLLYHIY